MKEGLQGPKINKWGKTGFEEIKFELIFVN